MNSVCAYCINFISSLDFYLIYNCGDEPGIMVGPNTLPFLHFSISAPMLTYHDAQNRRGASRDLREPAQCSIFVKSLLLATPLFGNI